MGHLLVAIPRRLTQIFLQTNQPHVRYAVKRARHDAYLLVAEGAVQAAGAGVDGVGVHAQRGAAVPLCVVLIERDKRPSKAAALRQRIDHQRVQHHDRPVRRVVLPRRVFVHVDLRLIDDGCRRHAPVLRQHEQVAARQRALRRRADGVHAADPADRGPPLLLLIVDPFVDRLDAANIFLLCLPDLHHTLPSKTASALKMPSTAADMMPPA